MPNLEEQVALLLQPPSAEEVELFFKEKTNGLPLEVRPDAGDGRGKGVFATQAISEDDLIVNEPPVVAIQEEAGYAVVCARCFRVVGSIEEQLVIAANKFMPSSSAEHERPKPKLPLSEQFTLPKIVPCKGSPCCDLVYCSEECRDSAWSAEHSLLCACGSEAPLEASSSSSKPAEDPYYAEFYALTNETNQVFKLAAQSIATLLLTAEAEVEKRGKTIETVDTETAWEALQTAWKPFQMGHKALWWEAMALPSDVPVEEESAFRAQIKELAEDSLTLFRQAVEHRAPALCTTFPAALHLHVWASLIGMFELNNLTMLVYSPVPKWAEAVDDILDQLTEEQKAALDAYEALQYHNGLDGIMEGEFEWVCMGNAFYSLQACMNHSCLPNARAMKREQDITGNAVILANRDIKAGEEVTISYVGEEDDLEERTEDLRDYGFTCTCERCEAERLASQLELL